MIIDATYKEWLLELKGKIRSTQIKAAVAVNSVLIDFYWDLGKMISEKQTAYGTGFIPQLSKDLREEFPQVGGLSERNLAHCRAFYQFYSQSKGQQAVALLENEKHQDDSILQQAVAKLKNDAKEVGLTTSHQVVGQFQGGENQDNLLVMSLVTQIPWGHNILIFTKSENVEVALFYIKQTIENQWSRESLRNQIINKLHKRHGKAISNFKNTLPRTISTLAQETLKDPYVFDFLSLDAEYREQDIENQLVTHVQKFLLELGKGFAFIGQQYHLKVSDNDYYIDLLFYHTRLKCYVVIELKNNRFIPEYTGKLNFYLSAVDTLVKMPDDNPTIGLLLCKEKDRIEAEFALRDINKPIGISEYLITKNLPENLKSSLPTIEEIERELGNDKL